MNLNLNLTYVMVTLTLDDACYHPNYWRNIIRLPSENLVMKDLSFSFAIQDSTDPSSTLPQGINLQRRESY